MTTKDRLYQLVDLLPEREWETAARVLAALRTAPPPSDVEGLHARLAAAGTALTPANPEPGRWDEPLPNLPGVDLSGAVVEEREEQASRWDSAQ